MNAQVMRVPRAQGCASRRPGAVRAAPVRAMRRTATMTPALAPAWLHTLPPRAGRSSRRASMAVRASGEEGSPPPPPPSEPKKKFSNNAKLRGEALAPFRTFRIFIFQALLASAGLGTLITFTKLIGIVGGAPYADPLDTTLQNLGIDVTALAVVGYFLSREGKAKNAQLQRITREETLSLLQVELSNGRVVPLSRLQGFARPVVVAGPLEFVETAMKEAEPFKKELLERGVILMPLVRGGGAGDFRATLEAALAEEVAAAQEEGGEDVDPEMVKRWVSTPVRTLDWEMWLDEQMSAAKVATDKGVYLSLRMDGRVRGSGTGRVPWPIMAAQLPPVKGMWKGFGAGFDGSVNLQ